MIPSSQLLLGVTENILPWLRTLCSTQSRNAVASMLACWPSGLGFESLLRQIFFLNWAGLSGQPSQKWVQENILGSKNVQGDIDHIRDKWMPGPTPMKILYWMSPTASPRVVFRYKFFLDAHLSIEIQWIPRSYPSPSMHTTSLHHLLNADWSVK